MPAVAAGAAAPAAQTGGKKEEGFQVEAPQAILIDVESGSVLFEKNADRQSPPSSMMKLMTVEVVFNEIKSGRLKLSEEYRISENAWRRGGRLPADRRCLRPFTAAFRSRICCGA